MSCEGFSGEDSSSCSWLRRSDALRPYTTPAAHEFVEGAVHSTVEGGDQVPSSSSRSCRPCLRLRSCCSSSATRCRRAAISSVRVRPTSWKTCSACTSESRSVGVAFRCRSRSLCSRRLARSACSDRRLTQVVDECGSGSVATARIYTRSRGGDTGKNGLHPRAIAETVIS
jgi:hypothetical protein